MAHILQENVLFNTLTSKELTYLTELVYERVYQPGETIFHENDRGLGMYIIHQGRIAIQSHSSQGEVLVTVLTDRSFFGEMALIDRENLRTASAVALERSVLVGFFISDLSEILERKPSMGIKILFQLSTVLARRLQETTKKITQLTGAADSTSSKGGIAIETAA